MGAECDTRSSVVWGQGRRDQRRWVVEKVKGQERDEGRKKRFAVSTGVATVMASPR